MATQNPSHHAPFTSAVERPLASLSSSLHAFAEDSLTQGYAARTTTTYGSNATSAIILVSLAIAIMYAIMRDYRRHADMCVVVPLDMLFVLACRVPSF